MSNCNDYFSNSIEPSSCSSPLVSPQPEFLCYSCSGSLDQLWCAQCGPDADIAHEVINTSSPPAIIQQCSQCSSPYENIKLRCPQCTAFNPMGISPIPEYHALYLPQSGNSDSTGNSNDGTTNYRTGYDHVDFNYSSNRNINSNINNSNPFCRICGSSQKLPNSRIKVSMHSKVNGKSQYVNHTQANVKLKHQYIRSWSSLVCKLYVIHNDHVQSCVDSTEPETLKFGEPALIFHFPQFNLRPLHYSVVHVNIVYINEDSQLVSFCYDFPGHTVIRKKRVLDEEDSKQVSIPKSNRLQMQQNDTQLEVQALAVQMDQLIIRMRRLGLQVSVNYADQSWRNNSTIQNPSDVPLNNLNNSSIIRDSNSVTRMSDIDCQYTSSAVV